MSARVDEKAAGGDLAAKSRGKIEALPIQPSKKHSFSEEKSQEDAARTTPQRPVGYNAFLIKPARGAFFKPLNSILRKRLSHTGMKREGDG